MTSPDDAPRLTAAEQLALREHEIDALGEDRELTLALLELHDTLTTWKAARRAMLVGAQRVGAAGVDHPELLEAGAEQVATGSDVYAKSGGRIEAALGRLGAVIAAGRAERTGGR